MSQMDVPTFSERKVFGKHVGHAFQTSLDKIIKANAIVLGSTPLVARKRV
jgi:hypothetical protein